MRQYLKSSVGKGSALGKVLKFCFGESFHFFLDKKVEQKIKTKTNAPLFLSGRRTCGKWSIGVIVWAWWMSGTNGQGSAA